MCGAVGESAGWRDGRDESDPIKFLLAKTLKMIRQEVREVQEGSEGGSGGRVGKGAGGLCSNWPRMHKCGKCEGTSEWPPLVWNTAALVIGASCRLVGGKRFLLLRTSKHKRKE